MGTKLEILNRALSWLGQPVINDPETPESKAGKILAGIFEQIRRGVLARYLWNFAEATMDTERLSDSESVYDDDYLYPEKCLKLLKVITDSGDRLTDFRLGYNVANDAKVIQISNGGAATLKVVFNYDVTNLAHWSPLACEVFGLYLAIGGSNAIMGKENQMIETLNKLLSEELKDAIAVDGQEQPMAVEEEFQTELARLNYDSPPDTLNIRFE